MVENTIVRVLHLDITVGNVISEPTIFCVILSSREEPMYIRNSTAIEYDSSRCANIHYLKGS